MASDDQVESPCDDRSRAPSTLRRPIAAAATTAGTVTATKMLMSKRHPRTTHPIPDGRACEKASSRALSSPVGLGRVDLGGQPPRSTRPKPGRPGWLPTQVSGKEV